MTILLYFSLLITLAWLRSISHLLLAQCPRVTGEGFTSYIVVCMSSGPLLSPVIQMDSGGYTMIRSLQT